MRWWIAICVVVTAAWLVGSAHAQVIEGTSNGDVLNGTDNGDMIYGFGGADTITAKLGGDTAYGGSGEDTLDMGCGYDQAIGNGDDDLIYFTCADAKGDIADCGSGKDLVFWRAPGTIVGPNCEGSIHLTARQAAYWAQYLEG